MTRSNRKLIDLKLFVVEVIIPVFKVIITFKFVNCKGNSHGRQLALK